MRYVILFIAFMIAGCQAPIAPSQTSAPIQTASLAPQTDPTPTPTSSPTNPCWFDDVAINGASFQSYPTNSRSAGNTWYECYRADTTGVWIGFYGDRTVYWGDPAEVLAGNNIDRSTCTFYWRNNVTTYAYSNSATLDNSGNILSIEIYETSRGATEHYDCHKDL